jgi:hypothetical protein
MGHSKEHRTNYNTVLLFTDRLWTGNFKDFPVAVYTNMLLLTAVKLIIIIIIILHNNNLLQYLTTTTSYNRQVLKRVLNINKQQKYIIK